MIISPFFIIALPGIHILFSSALQRYSYSAIPNLKLITTGKGNGLNLQGYDLSKTNLTSDDLSETNLRNVDLSSAILLGTNLERADLTNAKLNETYLNNANLSLADLGGATLYGAIVTADQLRAAKLSCTQMPDGTIAQKQDCSGITPESWHH